LRSPALISAFPKAGCHAVLASLSERYPPLEGRSPTCYSPVCHSTYPLRGFRVRLACVRHAASVDSEPGSNSHVKCVRLHPCGRQQNPLTRAPVDRWLSHVVQFVKLWVVRRRTESQTAMLEPFVASALTSRPARCHPLILDGFHLRASRRFGGLCLHVLSSFQRTGSSKRPRSGAARSTRRESCSSVGQPSSGEPFKLTERFERCQPLDADDRHG
jgi:hypothetical protein